MRGMVVVVLNEIAKNLVRVEIVLLEWPRSRLNHLFTFLKQG